MTGVLFAYMRPTGADAADFDAWYEREHVTGRSEVRGFRQALVFRAPAGGGARMTVYELDEPAVLRSAAYLALRRSTNDETVARLDRLAEFVRFAGAVADPTPGDLAAGSTGEALLAIAVTDGAGRNADALARLLQPALGALGARGVWCVDVDRSASNHDANVLVLARVGPDGEWAHEPVPSLAGPDLEITWSATLPWHGRLVAGRWR